MTRVTAGEIKRYKADCFEVITSMMQAVNKNPRMKNMAIPRDVDSIIRVEPKDQYWADYFVKYEMENARLLDACWEELNYVENKTEDSISHTTVGVVTWSTTRLIALLNGCKANQVQSSTGKVIFDYWMIIMLDRHCHHLTAREVVKFQEKVNEYEFTG